MRVYDDLYGLIDFDDKVIRDIVDSRIFQRLRRIRQLALAEYVFPGATHSRFSHSLGAAHLMRRITDSPKFKRSISKSQRKLLIRAALLHDIGHFPLSHSLEGVYKRELKDKRNKTQKRIQALSEVKPLSKLEKLMEEADQVHEAVSSYIIQSAELGEILERREAEEISQILLGDHQRLLYTQLLHSHLDVDTMDYLRRDAKATGINYGEFDDSYLVGNLRIWKLGDKEVLCVDSHATHTVEHYVLAKYFYYLQILYHKIRLGYELLAEICAYWMMKKGKLPLLENLQEWVDDGRFVALDDNYFIQTARSMQANTELPKAVDSLLAVISNREHLQVHYESKMVCSEIKDWENARRALVEETKHKARCLVNSNLLEDSSVIEAAPEGFPVSVEKREIYPTEGKTEENAREQEAKSRLEERDAIKILSGRKIENVNSLKESLIPHLAGRCTVLVRYYYIHKDRME